MKRFVAFLAALVLVCTSSLALADMTVIKGTRKNNIKFKGSKANNPVIEGEAPLTGLAASGEAYTPIITVLDNAQDSGSDNTSAYPHWGVSKADIIFQIPNAGKGATKLMALFANEYPEEAGGARSARATMVAAVTMFDAAFAYAGYPDVNNNNSGVPNLLKKYNMTKNGKAFNLLGKGGYATRVSHHKEPHNSSVMIKKIHEELVANNVSFDVRPFLFTDEARTEGADATIVRVRHFGTDAKGNSNPASAATYTYSEADGVYYRKSLDGDYTDYTTGENVGFANVIVLRSYFVFSEGVPYFKGQLTGQGTAEIFQNGKYVQGAWYRESETSRLILVDADGQELKMQRGKSFIIITNEVTEVAYDAL